MQLTHDPRVDAITQQQHLNTARAQAFDERAAACGLTAVSEHVIDVLLAGLHTRDIVGQRDLVFVRAVLRAGKAQQRQDAFAIGRVFAGAFFEHLAELFPERLIFFGLVFGQTCDQVQTALGQSAAHGLNFRIFLQQLARDVQRQIAGIEHALDEAQVQRQELLGVVHDEHAAHMQLQTARGLALPQVEGCR